MAVDIDKVKEIYKNYFTGGGKRSGLDAETIKLILDTYETEKLGPDQIVKFLKKEPYNLNIGRSTISRILTQGRRTNLIKPIALKDFKFFEESRRETPRYQSVRPITNIDRLKNPNIPENANFKVEFGRPQGLTTKIPKKFIGLQYFNTKKQAEKALKDRLSVSYKTPEDPEAPSLKTQQKRSKRLDRTVGRKAKYIAGTESFPFHHIMPIGGEVALGTRDVAIITEEMNKKLSPYNKRLNDIADAITTVYNNQEPGYLQKIENLNRSAEGLVKEATDKLPNKYKPYIGFTRLDPVFDEYGTPINLSEKRVGAVGKRGTKLFDVSKKQLNELKNKAKLLSEKEKIGLCSKLSRGGLPGDCSAAIDNDPVKAAKIFEQAPETSSAMTKLKNTAANFLKSPGLKRFTLAGAAGAAGAAIVKEFRNDDPTSYLSNEDQQKNMLVAMATDPITTDFDRPDILDYQLPAIGATIAGTTAYSAPSTIKASRSRGLGVEKKGVMRTAGRTLGRGLGIFGGPGILAPFAAADIAEQVAAGDSATDIATNPFNYLYPTFADQTPKLTKGLNPTFRKVANLGLGKVGLRALSRAGIVGLAASLGIQGMNLLDD